MGKTVLPVASLGISPKLYHKKGFAVNSILKHCIRQVYLDAENLRNYMNVSF